MAKSQNPAVPASPHSEHNNDKGGYPQRGKFDISMITYFGCALRKVAKYAPVSCLIQDFSAHCLKGKQSPRVDLPERWGIIIK